MNQGVNLLLAGLALQASSITLFFIGYWYLDSQIGNERYDLNRRHADVYRSSWFKIFLLCKSIL